MHIGPRPVPSEIHLSTRRAEDGVQGRLPTVWLCALAAGLAASAFMPRGPAWLVALSAIILLGVPHGALDGEVARPLLRPRFGHLWFLVFSAPYLTLSALVLLAWHVAPLPTLAVFFAASVWHFGEEDAGPGRKLELLLRGGAPIALPVLLHPAATLPILAAVTQTDMVTLPSWLVAASVAWAVLAVVAIVDLVTQRRRTVLREVAGVALAFALLPPLTAFALYFLGLHAPRHMAALVAAGHAPRVATMRAAILRSLPVTALTLLIGALLWRFYPGPAPERLLSLTLQGLAALTLPHLLLNHLAPAAPGGTAGPRPRTAY